MKTKNDVEGFRSGCFYYDPCPLCYGCRNYHAVCHNRCDERCAHTPQDKKKNVCLNKNLHNPVNFAKMIRRSKPVIVGGKQSEQ